MNKKSELIHCLLCRLFGTTYPWSSWLREVNACIHVIQIYVTPRVACWQVSRQNTQKSQCVSRRSPIGGTNKFCMLTRPPVRTGEVWMDLQTFYQTFILALSLLKQTDESIFTWSSLILQAKSPLNIVLLCSLYKGANEKYATFRTLFHNLNMLMLWLDFLKLFTRCGLSWLSRTIVVYSPPPALKKNLIWPNQSCVLDNLGDCSKGRLAIMMKSTWNNYAIWLTKPWL